MEQLWSRRVPCQQSPASLEGSAKRLRPGIGREKSVCACALGVAPYLARAATTRLELSRLRVRGGGLRAPSSSQSASGCESAVTAAGMFRKARRVNVRKRNDSEEEERERDEEQEPPPLLPPPASGEEPGPGGGDRAPAGESLLGPGPPPPPSAHTPGLGAEAGGGIPGGAEPGNGLKQRKRPRENKEVPRASLLSFQDEEEGEPPLGPRGLRARAHPSAAPLSPPPAFCSAWGCIPALPPAGCTTCAVPPPAVRALISHPEWKRRPDAPWTRLLPWELQTA